MKEIINEYLDNNKNLFPVDKDKTPLRKGWQDISMPREELEAHTGNFGWSLGKRDLIIDIDPKNHPNGRDVYQELLNKLEVTFEKTVKTQSGGHHIYLELPEGFDGVVLKKNLPEFPGIDFLRRGCFAVIAGSKGIKGDYEWIHPEKKFFTQEAPTTLIEMLKPAPIERSNSTTNVKPYTEEEVQTYLEHITKCSYDDWRDVAFALQHWCSLEGTSKTRAFDMFHEWSEKFDNYKGLDDVIHKWNNIGEPKKITQGTLARLAFKYSKYVPPREEKAENGELGDFSQWAYVTSVKEYYSFEKETFRTEKEFNRYAQKCVPICDKLDKHGDVAYRATAFKWIEKHEEAIKTYEHAEYAPEEKGREYVDGEGQLVLNLYDKSMLPKPAEQITEKGQEAIDFIDAHFKLIFNDDETESIFKNWIAFNRQRLGELLRWVPIIIGVHGTGKSSLGNLMKRIIGKRHYRAIENINLRNGFSEWAESPGICELAEIRILGSNRYSIANSLKSKIADEDVSIHIKGQSQYNVKNRTNYIAFTNYKDAIPLIGTERRYWMVQSPIKDKADFESKMPKKFATSGEYFSKFYEYLNDKQIMSEIIKYYQDMKISESFLNLKEAPKTEAFERAVATDHSNTYGESELEELLEEGGEWFDKDICCYTDLETALKVKLLKNQDEEIKKINDLTNTVLEAPKYVPKLNFTILLKKLGFQKIGEKKITVNGNEKRGNFWTSSAESFTPKQIASHFENRIKEVEVDNGKEVQEYYKMAYNLQKETQKKMQQSPFDKVEPVQISGTEIKEETGLANAAKDVLSDEYLNGDDPF